ncbi:PP2C family protein-serine/threonine phosphatase [Streptomyces sp. WAC06614]|uniref:PP2C family protein-serine/threonine phosphatase n=1 Tax=Streptomyces sp. WAC06614 TaxID=2487416 RepID=UPI000F7699A5|nr:GAF domain-containing SpoIIE family protein phosphatase [Streptomyces sp. WAC06614]RSS79154.1 PAS sensor protein [Streptomyces sp. WAC06614]
MLYLPAPDRRVLYQVLLSGVSRQFAAPWARVGLDDPIPVADAVRESRLVWLGSQQEMAQRYPRLGLVLPYDFPLAAAPLPGRAADGTGPALGGLVLLWPGSHPPQLRPGEREAMESGCVRLAEVVRRAADAGGHLEPGERPVVLKPPQPPTPGPVEAAVALAFVRRLPGGSCALGLNGKVAFITEEAAELLGAPVSHLLGALPWEALPWMDTPEIEDHYRAAVISRLPRTFTALRPPDRLLRFELYPDASGISVRITAAEEDAAGTPGAAGASGVAGASGAGPEGVPGAPGAAPGPADAAPAAAVGPGGVEPAGVRAPLPSRATALYQLMHLAASLTEAAHAHDVVEQAADQIVPALGPSAMALLVAEERRLHIVGFRGYTADLMARFDAEPVTADTPATRVLRSGTPEFFADATEFLAAYPWAVIQDDMAAWAFLPLIASGTPIGSLVLAYARPHPFPPGERAILLSIAGLIAQALDRARLFDSKHQLAHSLQTGLLPRTLPRMPRLEVAARYLAAAHGMDIGGDFYDLIRIDDSRLGAAIGDVQGHNVKAAALMGQVRTAVHASAGAPPGEVLARTNRLLTDLDPGLFTSCLYAHIDLDRHTAYVATAGHPPPLLLRPDGSADVVHLPPGLLLGIDPEATYTATEFPFPPGSLLALYTDGLVETPGGDLGEAIRATAAHLGEAAAAATSVEDLADALVHRSQGTAARTDDIALLLLRSTGPATAAP